MARDGRPPIWPTLLVVVGSLAMVALGLLALADRTRDGSPTDAATVTATPDATPTASPAATSDASPQPSGSPTETAGATPSETLSRSSPTPVPLVTVDVLNQAGVTGLAGRTAAVLAAAGWSVGNVDDAMLGAPSTTLYVPVGQEAAADVFIDAFPAVQRTRPAFEGLAVDGLTLVLAQPDAEQVVATLEASAPEVPAPVGTSP